MSEHAPSALKETDPAISEIWQDDDLSTWEKVHATNTLNEQNDILNDKELSDWEKLHAMKELGSEAVGQTLDSAATAPEAAEDDPFHPGAELTVLRNDYTDDKIDRRKPGHLEKGWTVDRINADGTYHVVSAEATTHDGKTTGVFKNVSRETLEKWQEQARHEERVAKSEAAIRQFNEKLDNNPANIDPNNLPAYEADLPEGSIAYAPEHTPGTPEYEQLNNDVYEGLAERFNSIGSQSVSENSDVGRFPVPTQEQLDAYESDSSAPEQKEKRKKRRDILERAKNALRAKKERRDAKRRLKNEAAAKQHQQDEDKISAKELSEREGLDYPLITTRIGRLIRRLKAKKHSPAEITKEDVELVA